mmetsp:Transcript_93492/g.185487  ORF Transcript_93492/g.185487 Transcript_93492/m.185487 type:complete len:237 (+) Transcript_93492:112-822(+)
MAAAAVATLGHLGKPSSTPFCQAAFSASSAASFSTGADGAQKASVSGIASSGSFGATTSISRPGAPLCSGASSVAAGLGVASAATASLLRRACTSSSVGHLKAALSLAFWTLGTVPLPAFVAEAAATAAAATVAAATFGFIAPAPVPAAVPPFMPALPPAIMPAAPSPGIIAGGMPGGTDIPGGTPATGGKAEYRQGFWAAAATRCSKALSLSNKGSNFRCLCCCFNRVSKRWSCC